MKSVEKGYRIGSRLHVRQPLVTVTTYCRCLILISTPLEPAQVAIHTAPYKSSSFLQPPQIHMIVQRPPSSSRWEMIAGLQFMVVCRKSQSLSRVGLSLSNRPITTPQRPLPPLSCQVGYIGARRHYWARCPSSPLNSLQLHISTSPVQLTWDRDPVSVDPCAHRTNPLPS